MISASERKLRLFPESYGMPRQDAGRKGPGTLRILGAGYGVAERSNSAYSDFHDVARRQRSNAGGSTGGNNVARLECHHLRDKSSNDVHREDHFANAG
jgi:hypothetical protein